MPLAVPILEAAGSKGAVAPLPAATFVRAVPGMGLRGKVNGEIYLAGNPTFFDNGSGMGSPQKAAVEEWERKGATVVLIGTERMPLGMIAIQDTLREEAKDGLTDLRRLGAIELSMLTGDNPETGKAIASQLSIDTTHAGLLPEQQAALARAVGEE